MTVYDLERLELSYAPPYSSAKDPVNIAGYVATNILNGDLRIIHWDELDLHNENITVIDVRTTDEINYYGTIPNSINIPIDELRDRTGELDRNKIYMLFCAIGLRSYIGYRILSQMGFNAVCLSGGYEIFRYANLKIKADLIKR